MHIAEGVLRPEILVAGAAAGGAVFAYAVWTLKQLEIPTVAALSALFFLASFVHIPIGVSSAHLILSGVVGALIGVRAFAAIGVALLFQSVLFGFGGVTTLGVNLCILALPALIARAIFVLRNDNNCVRQTVYFATGFVPVVCGAFLLSCVLAFNGDQFINAAKLAFAVHIPIMIIEGIITMLTLNFLAKVKPELLK